MQNNGFGAISSKSKRVVFAGLSNSNIKSGGQNSSLCKWQLPLKSPVYALFCDFYALLFRTFSKIKFSSAVAFFWHQNELLTPPGPQQRVKTRFYALFWPLRTFLRTLRTFLRTFWKIFFDHIFFWVLSFRSHLVSASNSFWGGNGIIFILSESICGGGGGGGGVGGRQYVFLLPPQTPSSSITPYRNYYYYYYYYY